MEDIQLIKCAYCEKNGDLFFNYSKSTEQGLSIISSDELLNYAIDGGFSCLDKYTLVTSAIVAADELYNTLIKSNSSKAKKCRANIKNFKNIILQYIQVLALKDNRTYNVITEVSKFKKKTALVNNKKSKARLNSYRLKTETIDWLDDEVEGYSGGQYVELNLADYLLRGENIEKEYLGNSNHDIEDLLESYHVKKSDIIGFHMYGVEYDYNDVSWFVEEDPRDFDNDPLNGLMTSYVIISTKDNDFVFSSDYSLGEGYRSLTLEKIF